VTKIIIIYFYSKQKQILIIPYNHMGMNTLHNEMKSADTPLKIPQPESASELYRLSDRLYFVKYKMYLKLA
jgi:hypothetical protein